jgi:hypothetical protein
LYIVVASQVVREDLSTTKEKAPSLKQAQKRRTIAFTPTPYTPPFNTPLGSRLGTASPSGEQHQSPSSLVDNDLELEAKFLSNMVIEM